MITKPYLLFAGSNYYPSGGAGDFIGSYETAQACADAFNTGYYNEWDTEKEYLVKWDWYQVVLHSTMETIHFG